MTFEVLSRQVVVAGRITDAISTGQPRTPPLVRVVDAADDGPLDHVTLRVLPDAQYAVFGDPLHMLPPANVDIRLEVEADGYQPSSVTLSFTAAELARIARSLTLGDETQAVQIIGGLPRAQDIALLPDPVTLKGRVSRAEDPEIAIAGASVSVTAPAALGPVLTDADGFFTLGPAPVAATVTLSVTATGRIPLDTDIRLNFAAPINRVSLTLQPT
ncbi:hypothetical protein RGUI_3692 [Rhodovulum sp. P5]|uniref:hypothetical protein n=1 Tax=Rhodovulum sp. P5 TaxID=1564506 RepID=UPI0009C1F6ED|nr:hypothetical protein [Rhodovulum sp. P5]ARE41833.1 hypothetical protein RGUI_3692 [Rhodovulum sp. P5]